MENDWMKENIHNFNHFCHHYHLFHVYTFSILPGYQSLSPTAVQMNCPRLPSETLVTQDWKRLEDPPGSSRLLGSWLILIAFNARVAKDITRRGNRKQVTRPCRIKSSIQILGHRDVRVDGKNEVLDPCGPKVGEVTGYSFPITSARRSLTDKYWHHKNQIQSNSIKYEFYDSTKFTRMKPDMALSSPFMEVLWLQQNTMIHSFWCQACNSSAIVARTSPRQKTELPKSMWISGFNEQRNNNMKMKYIVVPELHQPRLIKLRQDWSCKIVVETPQTDFSSSIRIPPSQSLQPSPAWPVNSEPQRHKFQTFQSQALLKATGKKIQKHIWNISNLHHIPINQLINQTATQMRGAHSGFSCDCNDCREQILSLCVYEHLRLRHKSSQLSIGWMPLHRIYFSWLLKLTKLYQITWIKHPKPKNCSISREESQKKTKTWSLDHPLITSSGFQETKNRVPRSGQNCSFQALQIPKGWLVVGSLLPHSHHPERHQNENLASKEIYKWKKPPATFAHRVDDSYDSLPFSFCLVTFRSAHHDQNCSNDPWPHKNSNHEVVFWKPEFYWGTNTVWIWGNWLAASTLLSRTLGEKMNVRKTGDPPWYTEYTWIKLKPNERKFSSQFCDQIPRLCSSHVPPGMDTWRCSFHWKAAPAVGWNA